jgi:ribosomal protein S18 acetylase RimI-like enzyme
VHRVSANFAEFLLLFYGTNIQSFMYILPLEFATPEYDAAVALRDEVLRRPLGLHFTPEQLAEEYGHYHLGAFSDDGHLIGYLNLTPLGDGTVQMRQVAVSPGLQRRGVGQALVAASEQLARREGFAAIMLHARDLAVPFYEKLGYVREGEEFEEVTIPHWQMRKLL